MALNHTEDWGLDGPSRMGGVAQWIGISIPCEPQAWSLGAGMLVSCENGLYLNQQRISDRVDVRAVAEVPPWIVAQGDDGVWVFDDQGRLVDVLALPTQSAELQLLIGGNDLLLQAPSAGWRLDAELLEFEPVADEVLRGSPPQAALLSEAAQMDAAKWASGEALSWAKLLQEIHTGRIFQPLGPLFLDLSAVALILLALLGILIDVRRAHPTKSSH